MGTLFAYKKSWALLNLFMEDNDFFIKKKVHSKNIGLIPKELSNLISKLKSLWF